MKPIEWVEEKIWHKMLFFSCSYHSFFLACLSSPVIRLETEWLAVIVYSQWYQACNTFTSNFYCYWLVLLPWKDSNLVLYGNEDEKIWQKIYLYITRFILTGKKMFTPIGWDCSILCISKQIIPLSKVNYRTIAWNGNIQTFFFFAF